MGLTLFHAEQCQLRSRSWVDSSHGSQFLRVLWPKPAMTAFPRVHLRVWDRHYQKGQKCGVTPGPLPKRTFFNVMLISFKKKRSRRRQEPLHLMWCYICHFLFHWKNYLLKLDVCIVSIYYPRNLSFSQSWSYEFGAKMSPFLLLHTPVNVLTWWILKGLRNGRWYG